jgi:hypothetical protein
MKRVTVAVIILIVLLGAYLFIKNQKEESRSQVQREDFLGLDLAQVTGFRLIHSDDTVAFSRQNANWYVNYFGKLRQADTSAVNPIITKIADMDVGTVISTNPDNRGQFGVDSTNATRFTFYRNDQKLADLFIGQDAPQYGSIYVRQVGTDEVYIGEGISMFMFNKPILSWIDKTIFTADTAALVAMEFEYPEEKFKLVRLDSVWFASGDNINQQTLCAEDTIELYKRFLASFTTDDFMNQQDSTHFNPDSIQFRLILRYEQGALDSLRLHGKAPDLGRYYLTSDKSDDVYVIYKVKYDRLTRKADNFIGS